MPKDRASRLRMLKRDIQKLSKAQLRELLKSGIFASMYEMYSEDSKTVPISKAKAADISRILEVPFPANLLSRNGKNWKKPEMAADYEPSATFAEVINMLERFVTTTGEPLTRTWIDVYILEALRSVEQPGTFKLYGEIAIKKRNSKTGEVLSGEGDYMLGYAENSDDVEIKNLVVIGEAKSKKSGTSDAAICQLFAYMCIVHLARKAANKKNANVFGFLSTTEFWTFFRIDNSGKAWRSKTFSSPEDDNEILNFLTFIFKSAQVASAPTSPFVSEADLRQATLYKSWENLPEFEPVHSGLEVEELEGDPLDFELMHAEIDDKDNEEAESESDEE